MKKGYTGDINHYDGRVDQKKEHFCEDHDQADGETLRVGKYSTPWYTKNMVERPDTFYRNKQRRRRRRG